MQKTENTESSKIKDNRNRRQEIQWLEESVLWRECEGIYFGKRIVGGVEKCCQLWQRHTRENWQDTRNFGVR